MSTVVTLDVPVLRILREVPEPLTADELLERVPERVLQEYRNPLQKLRNVLTRPEVGHAARERYVYLPRRITGSTLRLPLTGGEARRGEFLFPADLTFALWYRQVEWGRARSILEW